MPWTLQHPTIQHRKAQRGSSCFPPPLALSALRRSFVMLRPDIQWQNPVMFVVEVGAILTLAYILRAVFGASTGPFSLAISWRWTSGCG